METWLLACVLQTKRAIWAMKPATAGAPPRRRRTIADMAADLEHSDCIVGKCKTPVQQPLHVYICKTVWFGQRHRSNIL